MPEHFGSLCAYEHVSTPTHTMFINNCVQVHMVACVHAPSCHDPSASKITRIRCILPSVQTMTYIKWQAPGNSLLLAYLIFVQKNNLGSDAQLSMGFFLTKPKFYKGFPTMEFHTGSTAMTKAEAQNACQPKSHILS